MHNPRHSTAKLNTQVFLLVIAAILLPVGLVILVRTLGSDGQELARPSESGRSDTFMMIMAVAVILGWEWISERRIWQRTPPWVQDNKAELTSIAIATVWVGYFDTDPTLTGWALVQAFGWSSAKMLVVFLMVYGIILLLRPYWKARKQR